MREAPALVAVIVMVVSVGWLAWEMALRTPAGTGLLAGIFGAAALGAIAAFAGARLPH